MPQISQRFQKSFRPLRNIRGNGCAVQQIKNVNWLNKICNGHSARSVRALFFSLLSQEPWISIRIISSPLPHQSHHRVLSLSVPESHRSNKLSMRKCWAGKSWELWTSPEAEAWWGPEGWFKQGSVHQLCANSLPYLAAYTCRKRWAHLLSTCDRPKNKSKGPFLPLMFYDCSFTKMMFYKLLLIKHLPKQKYFSGPFL